MRPISVALTLVALSSSAALYAQTRPKTTPPPQTKPVTLPAKPVRIASVPTVPAGPMEPKDDKDTNYYPYGKLMTRVSEPAGVLWTLKGDAQLSHKDVKFVSDTVLYNEDTKIANAPGNLRIDDPQNTVTGDSGVAYYKKELRYADLVGDVKIVARPKQTDPKATTKSVRKEFKNPVTITCDKLRYWWKQKRGYTDTNVKITFKHKDKDWTITSNTLEYFGDDEHALLKGEVVALSDKGDKIYCDTADVYLKEGAEKVTLLPIKLGTIIKGDPDEDEDKTTPPPPVKPTGKGDKLTL